MSTATVTPGYVFANNELVTYPKLNALGSPQVSVTLSGAATGQNYLRNGNFYNELWTTPAGVSCPTGVETFNATDWSCNPQGAAVMYSQSTTVPNVHSLYTAEITGATNTTVVSFSQAIVGDLSDSLNNTVSFSCWIGNFSSINFIPTLIISSANAYNNFTTVTQIASIPLATIASGQWQYESTTINLAGLFNVNNGIKVTLQFPTGALSSNTQSVNISQTMLVIGSSALTFVDDFGCFPIITPASVQAGLGYAPLFSSNNNVVLNGNFDIDQPVGPYAGLTGNASNKVQDSWMVDTHGTMSLTSAINTGASIAPVNIFNPFITNSGKITVQTAESTLSSGDFSAMTNRVEGYLVESLQGRQLSLQFWVRSNLTGNFYVSLRNSNASAVYIAQYTINAASVWQQVTVQAIPAMPTAVGTWNFSTGLGLEILWCMGAGSTFQTAASNIGSWISSNLLCGTDQVNIAASTSNSFEITGVQLEPGSVCTPLNYIPFSQQIPLLQRYYWKSYAYAVAPGTDAAGYLPFYTFTTTGAAGVLKYPVKMRVAPTVTIYNPITGGAGAGVYDLTSATSIGSGANLNATSTEDGFSQVAFTSGGTVGHIVAIHAVADARL